jgi:plastocyanin
MSRFTQPLAVGAIALMVVLAACSSGASSPSASEAQPTTTNPSALGSSGAVEISVATDAGGALAFDPSQISVPAGAMVRLTFTNRATLPHNLTFGEPINVATATVVDPDASQTIEFMAPGEGTYPFVCTLHPGMKGDLIVAAAQ